jgi:Domain of unknown function (DUF4351)
MFHYFARLDEKYALPIYPVALFSFDTPQRRERDRYIVEFPDRAVLEFSYVAIQLNRLNWRDFLQQQNPVAAALMAKMKIQPKERAKVKAECLRLLATLRLDPARMQLISGFVDTYLRLNEEEEAIFKAEIDTIGLVEEEQVMEIVTSLMQQGINQGIEREFALVLRQVNRRFGGLNPTLEAQIRDLSIEQVEDLGEALFDFQTEADLVNWLNRN